MNWDAIGAVGEIVGAAAVVVTLIYVAVQIRLARSVATDSNRLNRANGVRDATLELVSNDSLFYSTPAIRHSWTNSPWTKSTLDQRFIAFVDEALGEQNSS